MAVNRTFLIDDDEIFRFAMERLIQLKQVSQHTHSFDTAAEALAYLKKQANQADELPDVILTDINLKTETAWEFIGHYENLKSSLCKLPRVYILSSSISPADAAEAKKHAEIDGYLTKPLSKENWTLIFES